MVNVCRMRSLEKELEMQRAELAEAQELAREAASVGDEELISEAGQEVERREVRSSDRDGLHKLSAGCLRAARGCNVLQAL